MKACSSVLTFLLVFLILGPVSAGRPDDAESVERFRTEALAKLDTGEWRVAEQLFRYLLDRTDTSPGADLELVACLSGLGKALVLQGEAGESRAMFERVLRILRHSENPDSRLAANALHGLARGALIEGKRGAATSFLMRERALREEWMAEEPLALARTLRELGRLRDSHRYPGKLVTQVGSEIELYELAIRLGRLDVQPFLERAAHAADRGDQAFRLSFLRAVAVSAENWPSDAALADALRGVAEAFVSDGQPHESLSWFERAWLIRPPSAFMRPFEAFNMYSNHKALVLALDDKGRWTYGFNVGGASEEESVRWARERCERRRDWRQVAADCRVYALNGKIVWATITEVE